MPERKLTDITVRRLRLPEGRREKLLGDGANLFLRLRPKSRDWLFVWKYQGKKQKLMLGPAPDLSLAEAREKAREAWTHLSDGKHPRVEREKRRVEQIALNEAQGAQPRTVDALFETWFQKEIEPQYADDGKEVRRRYEKDVAPLIGRCSPYAVVESDIVKVLDVVAARGANRVAGQMLADLRQMFKFAVRRKIAPSNPADDLSKEWKGESVERDRVLSELEILLLRDQIPNAKLIPETECAIWMMLGTALRVGELSQARWEWIVGDESCCPRRSRRPRSRTR